MPNGIPHSNTSHARIIDTTSTKRIRLLTRRKRSRIVTNEFSHASYQGNIENVIIHEYRVSMMDKIFMLTSETIPDLRLLMDQKNYAGPNNAHAHIATIQLNQLSTTIPSVAYNDNDDGHIFKLTKENNKYFILISFHTLFFY